MGSVVSLFKNPKREMICVKKYIRSAVMIALALTLTGFARDDGERFVDTILLEGMEERIVCEHVISEAMGIELDYDCESFDRVSESERERFLSRYDDPDAPENYLELSRSAEDAEAVAANVDEALSQVYDTIREPDTLDGAGSCIRIDACRLKGRNELAELMQTVYIIPIADGCIVAEAHFTIESAEGFGSRMRNIMNALAVE